MKRIKTITHTIPETRYIDANKAIGAYTESKEIDTNQFKQEFWKKIDIARRLLFMSEVRNLWPTDMKKKLN